MSMALAPAVTMLMKLQNSKKWYIWLKWQWYFAIYSLNALYLVIVGEENSEGKTKSKVRERKSSSVSDREPTISSSKTNSSDTRSSKACKVSPNPGCISFSFLIFQLWLFSCVYIFWTLISSYSVIDLSIYEYMMTSTILAVKLVTPPLLSPSPAPTPQHAEKEAPRGKNKFFLARWFGFGSKWIRFTHEYRCQLKFCKFFNYHSGSTNVLLAF